MINLFTFSNNIDILIEYYITKNFGVVMSLERDFSNFHAGDNVYELAGGVVPELANRLGVDVGENADQEALGRLVGAVGKNKVLRDNEEVTAMSTEEMAEMAVRSGINLALNRSLWTPDFSVDGISAPYVVTGAVANWQDRTVRLLQERAASETQQETDVFVVTGNRVMDSPTELSNPHVIQFTENYGKAPTETQYAAEYVMPKLDPWGYETFMEDFETANGDEIAKLFVARRPELFEAGSKLVFARVATAGVQLAMQYVKAARDQNPGYDGNVVEPQVYVVTDERPIARNDSEKSLPLEFQAPQPALRQMALTAKLLAEAARTVE